jgi:hypothetical protein
MSTVPPAPPQPPSSGTDKLDPAERVRSRTYLYLRLGMIGAVLLLFASIGKEYFETPGNHCFQNSISAYYYTPVRAIFVGTLFAVSFALIVYRAEGKWEDLFLNLAGMFVPIVAVAPTTDVGQCWSIAPAPPPLYADGSPQAWVVANIDNNMFALLLVGVLGLGLAIVLAVIDRTKGARRASYLNARTGAAQPSNPWVPLGIALLVLVVVGRVTWAWSNFDTRGHGYAAVLFFGFLILAVAAAAGHDFLMYAGRRWMWYAGIALAMTVIGIVFSLGDFGQHETAVLETLEILLFVAYWLAQIFEKHLPRPALKRSTGMDTSEVTT